MRLDEKQKWIDRYHELAHERVYTLQSQGKVFRPEELIVIAEEIVIQIIEEAISESVIYRA